MEETVERIIGEDVVHETKAWVECIGADQTNVFRSGLGQVIW